MPTDSRRNRPRCAPAPPPRDARRPRASGFTLGELLTVIAMVAVLVAVAVPLLLRARLAANEASALSSLTAIITGQVAYSSACGNNGYATAFAPLGVPPPGSDDAFLPPELSGAVHPQHRGYIFALAPGAGARPGPADCHGTATWTAYYTSAVPTAPGVSGRRAFAATTRGTIWQDAADGGAAAPVEPFRVTATVTSLE